MVFFVGDCLFVWGVWVGRSVLLYGGFVGWLQRVVLSVGGGGIFYYGCFFVFFLFCCWVCGGVAGFLGG